MASVVSLTVPGSRSPSMSMPSLPYQPSASASPLFASSPTSGTPRATSPYREGRNTTVLPERPAPKRSLDLHSQKQDDVRSLVTQSLVPHIAVHVSADTDKLAQDKGFEDGFWEMLRPYGERIYGKVTVRDGSVGASRSLDDFSVRFIKLGDGLATGRNGERRSAEFRAKEVNGTSQDTPTLRRAGAAILRMGGDVAQIEELVDRHLSHAEARSGDSDTNPLGQNGAGHSSGPIISPYYTLFLQRLLSGIPMSPHETFSHPVACIIAISSRNPAPIEALRQLYNSTSGGHNRLPQWVNGDYLRYYVLVHDEETDNIQKSMALFEQMKRHFGLHCHLLRLRSSQCVPTDDDSVRIPICDWISASEDLARIDREEHAENESDTTRCLYESDVTAIKTFVREMVTQSVVPFMERCVATWNDQIASRRRGISGRFVSLSKRLTVFGSSRGPSAAGFGAGSSGSNYDALQGFYRPDTSEAIMRKLGDFAFMLRDWKLAQSTYEILRADYNDDKAWKYHAGANEMTAISALLGQAKTKSETVDQMLDLASYSYISRCAAPYNALRCVALGAELLRSRGGPAADEAARWATRILEMNVLGPTGQALFTQQVAACYASRNGAGNKGWGSRPRKAALWNALAASAWLGLKRSTQARLCLNQAYGVHGASAQEDGLPTFDQIQEFVSAITRHLDAHSAATQAMHGLPDGKDPSTDGAEAESEQVDFRSHRKSLLGPSIPPFTGVDASLLSSVQTLHRDGGVKGDDFE